MNDQLRNTERAHARLRLLCDGGPTLDIAEAALQFSAARRQLSDFDSYRGLLALLPADAPISVEVADDDLDRLEPAAAARILHSETLRYVS